MNWYQHFNNSASTVAAPRLAGGTTLTVGNGTVFGTPTPTSPVRVSIRRANQPLCILKCTGRFGNVLTIAGSLEGTTDQDLFAGDSCWNAVTAQDLGDIEDQVDNLLSGLPTRTFTFLLGIGQPLEVISNPTNVLINDKPGMFVKAYAYAKTGPVGSPILIDLNKNGSSILTGAKLAIADGANAGTQTSFAISDINEGDLLTVDVLAVGQSTPGQDVTVELCVVPHFLAEFGAAVGFDGEGFNSLGFN